MAKNKFNNQTPVSFSGAIAQRMSKPTAEQKKELKKAKAELKLAENYCITEGDKGIRKDVIPSLQASGEVTRITKKGKVVPLKFGSITAPTYVAMLIADNHGAKIPF